MALNKPFDIKAVRDQKRMYLRKYTIDLATAKTNELHKIAGDFFNVIKCSGNATIRLNEDTAPAIDLRTVETVKTPFYQFYIDSLGTQAYGEVILLIGTDAGFVFEERKSSFEIIVQEEAWSVATTATDTKGVDISGYDKITIMLKADKGGVFRIGWQPVSTFLYGTYQELEEIQYIRNLSTDSIVRTISNPTGALQISFTNDDDADAATVTVVITGEK